MRTPAAATVLSLALAALAALACSAPDGERGSGDDPLVAALESTEATWLRDGPVRVRAHAPQEVADRLRELGHPSGATGLRLRRTSGDGVLLEGAVTTALTPHEPGEADGAQTVLVAPVADGGRGRLVVTIVADTLRADVAAAEMELARRFDDGLRLPRAYAPSSWTLPSVASMFVSRPPAELRAPDGGLIALPAGQETLALRARRRGMAAAAVVGNPTVNHDNGFSQGFDAFVVPAYLDGWQLPDASWINDQALRLLDWFPGRDLFLYLHYVDPHDPYRDHESGTVLTPPATGAVPDDIAALWRAYRSEARHLDRAILRLLRDVEERRPIDLLIFTADHGEEFLDHGGLKHGPTVYPEVSRVPLWIGGPEGEALARSWRDSGRDPGDPVSLTELAGLVLDPAAWRPGPEASVETLAHGPPRFAWLDGEDHWQLASRWATPPPTADPIELWLRQHLPAVVRRPAERPPGDREPLAAAAEREAGWSEVPDELWGDLIRQLAAIRGGRWWFARGTALPGGVLAGAREPGWLWGTCDSSDGSEPTPRSVCLAFLAGEPRPGLDHDPAASRWVLPGRPDRLPPAGVVTWLESPRDAAYDIELGDTMRRLEAMGYLR